MPNTSDENSEGKAVHCFSGPQGDVGLLHDSLVANIASGQYHREIMVYDRAQAYPEYIVHVEVK